MSNIHTGTIEFISSFQQSFKRLAICSLVVVKKSHVHALTCTNEPMDLYMDSIFFISNSPKRSSLLLSMLLLDEDVDDVDKRPADAEDEVDEAEEAAHDSSSSS